jgi:hypothetical protein
VQEKIRNEERQIFGVEAVGAGGERQNSRYDKSDGSVFAMRFWLGESFFQFL